MTKKQSKTTKVKKGAWFVPVRGSYLPASLEGWLCYVPFTAYLVFALVTAVAYTGSNVKAVLWVVPNWVAAAVVMTWIAKQKS